MKFQNLKYLTVALGLTGAAFSLSANTTILVGTDFSDPENDWIAGSNKFVGGNWQEFVGSLSGAYTVADRIDVNGDQITFSSWDDGASDFLENFLFQEYGASPSNSEFNTGDVIVFKGTASVVKTGANTEDVIARAFVKTLGFVNNLEFQTKAEYTQFFDLTSEPQSFELRVTFPDLAVDDSLQVLQIGFEASAGYDPVAAATDTAVITFSNLEGYVEGDGGTTPWLGYEVQPDGSADTDTFIGWVDVDEAPWIWSYSFDKYLYIIPELVTESGGWIFVPR